MSTSTDYLSTIYVVNWDPAGGVGGFEWRTEREDAARYLRFLADPTARLHTVAVPEKLATADVETITEWLDDEGWSDGGDPRLPAYRQRMATTDPDASGGVIVATSDAPIYLDPETGEFSREP